MDGSTDQIKVQNRPKYGTDQRTEHYGMAQPMEQINLWNRSTYGMAQPMEQTNL